MALRCSQPTRHRTACWTRRREQVSAAEPMGPPFCKGHSRRQLGGAPEEAEEPLDDDPGAPRRAEPEQRRETKATQSPRQGVDPLEKESHPRIYTVDGFQARQGATKLKRIRTRLGGSLETDSEHFRHRLCRRPSKDRTPYVTGPLPLQPAGSCWKQNALQTPEVLLYGVDVC